MSSQTNHATKGARLELVRDWGKRKKGAMLEVLLPGEDIRSGAVDPLRAQTLLDDGFAEVHEPKAKKAKKDRERKGGA